jgi:NAD(P)-dependent dehydrogenase (short-subunit alcohol dehydrogenase family)
MKTFDKRVAVITGAASGFGREFARLGARRGMKLVLADIDGKALEQTRAELQAGGAEVVALKCDVRKCSQIEQLADTAMRHFGAVHLVFNNAGVGCGGLIWESTESDWEWVLGVNLWGVINGVRIFTNLMLDCARKDSSFEGHIVNTASMAGLVNAPAMGVYNVSKHAVVSLSESLYHDLALVDAPIGTSVLCPYFVSTGISESHRNRPGDVAMADPPTASQLAAQNMVNKAVTSSRVSAVEVAEATFKAIENGQFYVFSHPHALAGVHDRMQDVVEQRNPGDPYKDAPGLRDMLIQQIGPTI